MCQTIDVVRLIKDQIAVESLKRLDIDNEAAKTFKKSSARKRSFKF